MGSAWVCMQKAEALISTCILLEPPVSLPVSGSGTPLKYFCTAMLPLPSSPASNLTVILVPDTLHPESVGPETGPRWAYELTAAPWASRTPTSFLDRGWIGPM
jgi:hypothetical protein